MSPWLWRGLIILITSSLLLMSLAVTNALRDVKPPQLYIEVPERVLAHQPFEVFLSASDPVTYEVRYGDVVVQEVTQNYSLSLLALEGEQTLEVRATDAADNEVFETFVVYGIPVIRPQLSVPEAVIPGQPFSVMVTWDEAEAQVRDVQIRVAEEPLVHFRLDATTVGLGVAPLGTTAQTLPITVILIDEHARQVSTQSSILVLDDPREVQELNVSASTLQVVTPEGRELETRVMDEAYRSATLTPIPAWSETFVQPTEGRFSSPFGLPRRFVAGGNISFHYGTDIAAPTGTPILASNSGRVLVADFFPIKGGLVVIDHGATVLSLYFHQSRIRVEVGQEVARGEIIGEVGSTGLSTGPHLHWEMRVNSIATDPMSWVDRMLP